MIFRLKQKRTHPLTVGIPIALGNSPRPLIISCWWSAFHPIHGKLHAPQPNVPENNVLSFQDPTPMLVLTMHRAQQSVVRVQETNRASLDSGGMNEVPCPHIVDEACRRNVASILFIPERSHFPSFSWHFQFGCFPKSVHAFVIDHFASSTKKNSDPAVAKPRSTSN
jgi:hypothetical protein